LTTAVSTNLKTPDRWIVRDFDAALDAEAVTRLDTSYTSNCIYEVRRAVDVLLLEPSPLDHPRVQRFPVDLKADEFEHGKVAVLHGAVRGFIGWAFAPWNRRMTIWHFYVDLPYRRRGGGKILMDAALEWARRAAAVTAWVETSQVNYPGIAAYQRLGFEICGFDTTLYRGSLGPDEVAVFLSRVIA
jgi:GNAT superfamily N-acetyltransferase